MSNRLPDASRKREGEFNIILELGDRFQVACGITLTLRIEMKPPEEDFAARTPIWDSMQCLYMDTDVTLSYDFIARTCLESKYSFEELEKILFNEVLPALKFNMFDLPAPEWVGFETQWVADRILKTNRFGKRKPWVLRQYTQKYWNAIVQGMGKPAPNKVSEAIRYLLRRSRFLLLALGHRVPSTEGIAT